MINNSWLCPLYMIHKLYCTKEVEKINTYAFYKYEKQERLLEEFARSFTVTPSVRMSQ